ncbi:hypothetical protein JTZ10_13305 [Gordonia rubripertincta]|uniref:Uncharacterized protein n=1 Tax=Gordonia rubripertincta TaxID=36822 RepID=A0AAW4G5N8_GORRU|nr:hypothetical protein [Gordonia rubripertincta]MBM7278738.1 hypothetical protein [Gordonia rubripertincta]
MNHLVPAARIIAALVFSAALAGGVATANAQPCKMLLPNGQLAPCAPDVISTMPGEYGGGGNDAASEPGSFEHKLVNLAPAASAPAEEEPVDEDQIDIPQPEVKDPDQLKEEREQKEKEEREKKEKEEREKKEQQEKEQQEKEQQEKEQQEKVQNG